MLKEAIAYIVGLAENKTYTINGEYYSDHPLHRVAPHVPRAAAIEVNGLDSIVKLVRNELGTFGGRILFIRVEGPRRVSVFTDLDDNLERDSLYRAVCDAPDFKQGWRDHEAAIIELRSAFVPSKDVDYLLGLLSRVSREEGVTSEDNGVSQTVVATQGIALKRLEQLKPRVSLSPYRTFSEIEQPESEFILRMDEEGRVGLFEADGGKWKMGAKARIADYFESALSDETSSGSVVVMM